MKKVILSEGELKNLIKSLLNKTLKESEFSIEPNVPETKRESGLKNIFGSYSTEIPNDIIRYMRKNPRLIIKRLMELYGDRFFDYVGDVSSESNNK